MTPNLIYNLILTNNFKNIFVLLSFNLNFQIELHLNRKLFIKILLLRQNICLHTIFCHVCTLLYYTLIPKILLKHQQINKKQQIYKQ